MTIEDDPFMLEHGAGSETFAEDANLSDWTDIVQDALRTARQTSNMVSPEMITQLKIALSAITPQTRQTPHSADGTPSSSASISDAARRED